MSEVTQADRQALCDICCRPKSRHLHTDLQCPETTYFRPMPANQATRSAPLRAAAERAAEAEVDRLQSLQSSIFESLRHHDVSDDCFAEVASITQSALTDLTAAIQAAKGEQP